MSLLSIDFGAHQLRAAKPADARAIAEVNVACWRETYTTIINAAFLNALSVDDKEVFWRKNLEGLTRPFYFCWVLENKTSKKIEGYMAGGTPQLIPTPPTGNFRVELYSLYLLKNLQGQGLGQKLLQAAFEICRHSGFAQVFLWVNGFNPARKFYEKQGGVLLHDLGYRYTGEQKHEDRAYAWDL